MDIKKKVGERIRQLRKEKGLSQEGLANEAGVDRTYMTDVENGRRNISIEVLAKIISALDITEHIFFSSKEFNNG